MTSLSDMIHRPNTVAPNGMEYRTCYGMKTGKIVTKQDFDQADSDEFKYPIIGGSSFDIQVEDSSSGLTTTYNIDISSTTSSLEGPLAALAPSGETGVWWKWSLSDLLLLQ